MQEESGGKKANENDENDGCKIADLLAEFADVILLNKIGLVTGTELRRLKQLLSALNPGAKVIPTECKVRMYTIYMHHIYIYIYALPGNSVEALTLNPARKLTPPRYNEYGVLP